MGEKKTMNESQHVGEHKGYTMTCEGISYCCVALRLRGYRGELELIRAINRELKLRAKKAAAHAQG